MSQSENCHSLKNHPKKEKREIESIVVIIRE